MSGYPSGFLKTLWWIGGLTLVSGLLLIPTVLDLRLEWTVPWRLDGGQRSYVAAIHAAAVAGLLVLAGALWTVHMRRGWRQGRNRTTGAALAALVAVLTLTAIGVLYLGDETLSLAASLAHTVVGGLSAIVLLAHVAIGRSGKTAAHATRRHQ